MQKSIENLDQLTGVADELLSLITTTTHPNKATIVCLSGDLGAGKTTFTKVFAEKIGLESNISSPTFVIERAYPINFNTFKTFIHIDAYRMESENEIVHLGWNEIINNQENLIFIEWPEKVSAVIPEHSIYIVFAHGKTENERTITINETYNG